MYFYLQNKNKKKTEISLCGTSKFNLTCQVLLRGEIQNIASTFHSIFYSYLNKQSRLFLFEIHWLFACWLFKYFWTTIKLCFGDAIPNCNRESKSDLSHRHWRRHADMFEQYSHLVLCVRICRDPRLLSHTLSACLSCFVSVCSSNWISLHQWIYSQPIRNKSPLSNGTTFKSIEGAARRTAQRQRIWIVYVFVCMLYLE